MRGAGEEGFGGVGGEELGAEFCEVDFLGVGCAFGVCEGRGLVVGSCGVGRGGGEGGRGAIERYLLVGPLCG